MVVVSEENYLGFGYENTKSWFQLSDEYTPVINGYGTTQFKSAFKLKFTLLTNVKHNHRSIYTLLDFLGDIGGLFDALKVLGLFFIFGYNLIFGSILEKYLLSRIFLIDPSQNKDNQESKTEKSLIEKLRTFKPFGLSKSILAC